MFHVGQKVVCINDRDWGRNVLSVERCIPNRPVKGGIYSVRSILSIQPYVGLHLEEIVNPVLDYGFYGVVEAAFVTSRFRPIRETDIAVFTAMLDSVPVHEKENV